MCIITRRKFPEVYVWFFRHAFPALLIFRRRRRTGGIKTLTGTRLPAKYTPTYHVQAVVAMVTKETYLQE